MLGDFLGSIEGICGGDDGADGHDGEANNGEVDRIWGKEEDDVAFSDAHVGKGRGDGVDGVPEIGVGYVVAGGGVDQGDFAVMRTGRDKRRGIEGFVRGKWDWAAFAVEDFCGLTETASWIHFDILTAVLRHGVVEKTKSFSQEFECFEQRFWLGIFRLGSCRM